jgi:hypothetical protein
MWGLIFYITVSRFVDWTESFTCLVLYVEGCSECFVFFTPSLFFETRTCKSYFASEVCNLKVQFEAVSRRDLETRFQSKRGVNRLRLVPNELL